MGRRQNQRNQRPFFEQRIYSVNAHDSQHENQCNPTQDELQSICLKNMQITIKDIDHLIDELKNKIKSIEKNGVIPIKKKWWQRKSTIKLCLMVAGILFLIVLFTSIFQPNDYKNRISSYDAKEIIGLKDKERKVKSSDIYEEVNSEMYKYERMRSKISVNDSVSLKRLNEAFIDKLKKRNDDFLREKEKEKDSLVRDVVIINLVARYFIIFTCIVGFVVLVWAYSKYQFRDDVFE